MKLYTRLIEEGVFIFWSSDEGNTSYNLKIRIAVGNGQVELLNLNIPKGQNYFSFDKIGSGDYEIELNGYKENRIYQTETKKIKITSSVQRSQEQTEKLMEDLFIRFKGVYAYADDINMEITRVLDEVTYIKNALTDAETMYHIRKRAEYYNKNGFDGYDD